MKSEPAFPNQDNVFGTMQGGLTKREWFAGLAMQGILATNEKIADVTIARWSVSMADALISELQKEKNDDTKPIHGETYGPGDDVT